MKDTGAMGWLRHLERVTRPVDPETRDVLDRRWDELPEGARTTAQTLGRAGSGCEGTHGVFPRCNFSCRPCYHSREANHVRVDGPHTLAQVEAQMQFLRANRAPHAHAQLIGGEMVPKFYAVHRAEALAMTLARPLGAFRAMLRPLIGDVTFV